MTHNDKVLALLSDGQPHHHHELYALNVIAHSRISELRKRGHTIEMWREDDLYWYCLTSSARGNHASSPHLTVDSLEESGAAVVPSSASPEQLVLVAA